MVLCQAGDGTVIGPGSAPYPPGTECGPADWRGARQQAGEGLLGQAAAVVWPTWMVTGRGCAARVCSAGSGQTSDGPIGLEAPPEYILEADRDKTIVHHVAEGELFAMMGLMKPVAALLARSERARTVESLTRSLEPD